MMETKVENRKYNSYYLSFWIGDDNAVDDYFEKLNEEGNHFKVTENWIRNRMEDSEEFFNAAIGECEEDFLFILRCVHENEHGLPYDEWDKEYGPWVHLMTPEQVAYEYYGKEELLLLIPEWHAQDIMDHFDDKMTA